MFPTSISHGSTQVKPTVRLDNSFRATEIISNRFEGRQGVTNTGIARSTADKITELCAQIEQDHGGLDVIFANNHVNSKIDADSILDTHAARMFVTLQKLQHLVRNGGAIVICASFPLESRGI